MINVDSQAILQACKRPTNAVEALRSLDEVTGRLLAAQDRRAAFADLYALVTRRVVERLFGGTFFVEPLWISRLAGRFCERYLETLTWSLDNRAQDTGAWEVAYAACDYPDASPMQCAMLGMSAHINYDLAVGIAANIEEFGGKNDPRRMARYQHDHDIVNDLLKTAIEEVLMRLDVAHNCRFARLVRAYEPIRQPGSWLMVQMLGAWRSRVWQDAVSLLSVQDDSHARERLMTAMACRSHRITRILALSRF